MLLILDKSASIEACIYIFSVSSLFDVRVYQNDSNKHMIIEINLKINMDLSIKGRVCSLRISPGLALAIQVAPSCGDPSSTCTLWYG